MLGVGIVFLLPWLRVNHLLLFSHLLIAKIESVVTGQARILEWKNIPRKQKEKM